MEALLSDLLSFPPQPPPAPTLSDKRNDELHRAFHAKVKRIPYRELLKPISSESSILDILDPSINTISYSFVLLAHVKRLDTVAKRLNQDQLAIETSLWFKIVDFLNNADSIQLRYLGEEVTEIVNFLEPLAQSLGKPGTAVAPIARFILRLDPQGSTLSSQHLRLCQIALRTGTFSDAAEVLERDILFLPSETSHRDHKFLCSRDLSPRHFITETSGFTKAPTASSIQEYFLLGANILIGLHNWNRAAQFLENVISYPTKSGGFSGPMVEAYKKWMLVQLMLHGRVPKLPRMINAKTSEAFQIMAAPYEAVASLFEKGTATRLSEEIDAGAQKWAEDGNTGLMKVVLESYQERRIMSLSSVFTKVPISDIIHLTSCNESGESENESAIVELIKGMIKRSQLLGKLTTDPKGRSFLCFDGSTPQDELVASQIPAAVCGVNNLMEDLRAISRSIATEKDYLRWMQKQQKNSGVIGAQSMIVEDSGWPIGPDEEDLMAN